MDICNQKEERPLKELYKQKDLKFQVLSLYTQHNPHNMFATVTNSPFMS